MTSRIEYNNPDAHGFFGLPYHYELLADRHRILTFKRAIERVVAGKRVLESGTGSGILSLLAAQAGARAVYAVEKDPKIAEFARKNIAASKHGRVVRLIEADIREVSIGDLGGEQVDVVLAENLSTWQVTEPQISVMNYINEHLATDSAVRIPESVDNRVELVCARYRFEDLIEVRTRFFGFSGIPRPVIMSKPVSFRKLRFGDVNGLLVEGDARISALQSGVVNALRLTSPLKVFGRIRFRSSDSLMPPVIVPLSRDLVVKEGERVNLRLRYRCEADWEHFECDALLASDERTERVAPVISGALPELGADILTPSGFY